MDNSGSPSPESAAGYIEAFRALYVRLEGVFAGARARPEAFRELVDLFEGCEAYLREYFQEATKPRMVAVVERLRSGAELGGEELEILRQWIIGDTVNYVRNEKHFVTWMSEFHTVMSGLAQTVGEPQTTMETVARARGLLMDGARLLPNIVFFLEQKQRMVTFERAVGGSLDEQDRTLLLELIAKCWYSADQ